MCSLSLLRPQLSTSEFAFHKSWSFNSQVPGFWHRNGYAESNLLQRRWEWFQKHPSSGIFNGCELEGFTFLSFHLIHPDFSDDEVLIVQTDNLEGYSGLTPRQRRAEHDCCFNLKERRRLEPAKPFMDAESTSSGFTTVMRISMGSVLRTRTRSWTVCPSDSHSTSKTMNVCP